jgi:hypothetical protein
MPERAVAFGLGRIEAQLLVEVIEPDRLQIVIPALSRPEQPYYPPTTLPWRSA